MSLKNLQFALSKVVSEKCVNQYIDKHDFFNIACGKELISKLLGYAIILGAVFVKIPQVLKILQAGSGEGVSLLSQLLELLVISATLSYSMVKGFPFSSYGEAIFLALQTSFIAFLILFFGRGTRMYSFIFMATYAGAMSFLCSPQAPLSLLSTLQALSLPIVVAAKLVQIIANYRNGGTGQLSLISFLLIFLGSVARIFTSIQETGDNLVVTTYMVSSTFNFILVAQILYYGRNAVDHAKRD